MDNSRKEIILKRILNEKIIAVVRLRESSQVVDVVEAIIKGGIKIIELTLTTPNAIQRIEKLKRIYGNDVLIGAGSVLNGEMAEEAIEYGAEYIVSPISDYSLIDIGHSNEVPVMLGAFSPTEIYEAQEKGADVVKVFPADILGMKYFKAIKAPMPHLQIMPTGGVSLTNAKDWLDAGACAVGIGSALIPSDLLQAGDFQSITKNAQRIVKNVKYND